MAVAYVMYKIVITKGENGTEYYKQRIGVDIDGVLNNHENVFVEILKETTGKSLKCSDIKSLPVSISTDVTRDEEHNIFETKEYLRCIEFCIAFSRDFSPVFPDFSPKSAKMPI